MYSVYNMHSLISSMQFLSIMYHSYYYAFMSIFIIVMYFYMCVYLCYCLLISTRIIALIHYAISMCTGVLYCLLSFMCNYYFIFSCHNILCITIMYMLLRVSMLLCMCINIYSLHFLMLS